jgi:hypothetical protein
VALLRYPTIEDKRRWMEMAGVKLDGASEMQLPLTKMQVAAAVLLLTDASGAPLFGVEDMTAIGDLELGGDFDRVSTMAMQRMNPPATGAAAVGNG